VWFFLTPVIYPVSLLPERYRGLLTLNPMVGTIEAFRAVVLDQSVNWLALAQSALLSAGGLTLAVIYFIRVERKFADVV
jgi:lipopolysaccharide transport system permease protein